MELVLVIMIIFYAAIEVVEIKGELYVRMDNTLTYKERCNKII